jgi:hypothetical protein
MRLRETIMINKISLPLILFVSISLIELFHFTRNGLGNDFDPFYEAAHQIRDGVDPWTNGQDSVYSAYVNGPLTTIFIVPLSFLPQNFALLVLRLITLLCLPIITKIIWRGTKNIFSIDKQSIYLVSSILALSYPVRANLEYGQFFVLILTAVLYLLFKDREGKLVLRNDLSVGFALVLALDFKPQVFLPLVGVVLIKRLKVILGMICAIFLEGVLSFLISHKAPFHSWIHAITARKAGGFTTSDQMNLYSLVDSRLLYIIIIISSALILRSGIVTHINAFNNIFQAITFLSLIWFIFVPYLHPTDLILPVAALIIQAASKPGLILYFNIGLVLVWSNSNSALLFMAVVIFLITKMSRITNYFWVIIAPVLFFVLWIKFHTGSEENLRKILNYLALWLFLMSTISTQLPSLSRLYQFKAKFRKKIIDRKYNFRRKNAQDQEV